MASGDPETTNAGKPFRLDPNDPASPYLRRTGYREVSFAEADALARQWAEGSVRSPAEHIEAEIEEIEDENPDLFVGAADPYVEDYEKTSDGVLIPRKRKRYSDVVKEILIRNQEAIDDIQRQREIVRSFRKRRSRRADRS